MHAGDFQNCELLVPLYNQVRDLESRVKPQLLLASFRMACHASIQHKLG